jgi:hypothetical protein
MNRFAPLEQLIRLFTGMAFFGIFLLIPALVWGVILRDLPGAATSALIPPGVLAAMFGLRGRRKTRKTLARLRNAQDTPDEATGP